MEGYMRAEKVCMHNRNGKEIREFPLESQSTVEAVILLEQKFL